MKKLKELTRLKINIATTLAEIVIVSAVVILGFVAFFLSLGK